MSEEQPKIHPTSTKAYGEENSQLYNRARPSYHPTVVAFMRETIKKPGPLNIVEIGSGSGILTRNVLDHPLWSTDIAAIQAIEPNEGLRLICSDVVKDPRVTVRDGTFENTGVENGWADVILMASIRPSAFHWCLNYKDAMTEFARILKPDGVVVCVWYEGDREISPFVTKLWSLEEYLGDFSQHQYSRNTYYQQLWRSAFTEPNFLSHFTAPEEDIIKYVDSYTVESWSDFVMTWSWVAVLSEDQKNAARKGVKEVVEGGEEVGMKWVDKEHGVWEHPWKSRVVVFRRKVNTNV